MIKYETGNLLDQTGLIIHGCNAQGVMGSGVALAVKQKYPSAFKDYYDFCNNPHSNRSTLLGNVIFTDISNDICVASAITQECYGRDGIRYVNYEALSRCFEQIARLKGANMKIHIPTIGAGLGGGNWKIISTIIDETIGHLDVTCWTLPTK